MAVEIEIKLSVQGDYCSPILSELTKVLAPLLGDVRFSEKALINCYFDTPDFQLNQNRVALRIREKQGESGKPVYIQTLKTAGKSENGLSQRGEWEWNLHSPELDLIALASCDGWPKSIPTEKLVAVFETNFMRYQTDLSFGLSCIELALDWGKVLSNGKEELIHEIELELKEGEQKDLLSLAEKLKRSLPLIPADISKAERGFRLFRKG